MQEVNKKVEEWLLNPPVGSKAAAAKEFGVDLTLLIRQYRMTPQQRINELQTEMEDFAKFERELKIARQK